MTYPNFDGASCREVGTDLFYFEAGFGDWSSAHRDLRRLCQGCPVQTECLDWALKHEEFGWWGGYSPRERATMRREMGVRLASINPSLWLEFVS